MGFFSFGTGVDKAKDAMTFAKGQSTNYSDLLQSYLSQVRGSMSPYLNGSGQGYDPLQVALMKSRFLNDSAGKFKDAGSAVMTALARRGSVGNAPVGGDYTRGIAGLEGAKADTVSSGLTGIDLSNLQQALQNKFTAAGVMSGNAGQLGGAMSSFNGMYSNALNDYMQNITKGFGGQFMGTLGKTAAGGNLSMSKQL